MTGRAGPFPPRSRTPMTVLTREMGAGFAFIERNFNLVKRYWGWEMAFLVYAIAGAMSITLIGTEAGSEELVLSLGGRLDEAGADPLLDQLTARFEGAACPRKDFAGAKLLVVRGEDGGSQQTRIDGARASDRKRSDRHAGGHLDDRQKAIHALQRLAFDWNAEDGQAGHRCRHDARHDTSRFAHWHT